ncbi:hypothetical protein [Pedobacter endophyticus]|uniref:Uncharacterized protein n=1 Tax=Pedobacter endophyticus TaxID=2789740 RepID=A0A7U3SQV2_9SPHI|nr:hypothetical protein [Pedobacter endophyticus]QPH38756.1 hypothetical protein IZT61_17030 [Pedobacter endophyticus]
MKTYLILILCLLNIGLKAQKLAVGDVAQINLPKDAKQLKNVQILANPNSLITKSDIGSTPKTLYEKNGAAVGLWGIEQGSSKRTLEEIRAELIEVYKLSKTFLVITSEIKMHNGVKYLILQTKEDNEYYYRIISEAHNNRLINGFVKYKNGDKDNATTILAELLSNLQFKQ